MHGYVPSWCWAPSTIETRSEVCTLVSFLCLEIGKASPSFKEGSAVGYYNRVIGVSSQPHTSHFRSEAHFENQFDKFEVLIGDPRAIRWVACRKRLNVQRLNATPVEGGTISKNGAPLYLTRVRYDDGVHAAKIGDNFMVSRLAFGRRGYYYRCKLQVDGVASKKRFDRLSAGLRSIVPQSVE
jgi:hypothetical protein